MKRKDFAARFRAWAPLAASLLVLSAQSQARSVAPEALPTGFQLIAGSGAAAAAGNVLNVNQASSRAVFGWSGFDIGAAATVNFRQPAGAVALNLIGGVDASAIYGKLNADAQVFLANPNGVLFGRGAEINVGGLLATTMSIGAADFMNGNWRLSHPGGGAIRNEGLLKAAGSVALVGNTVDNPGSIFATTVTLAAGNTVAVDLSGDGLIRARVEDAALRARIDNSGSIEAKAAVALTVGQARDTIDRVVNNSGIVRATGLAARGGEIVLEGGTVTHSGTLEVADGGRIELRADDVLVAAAGSHTRADGGSIRLWSDHDTFAHGSFRAHGGFIETSGKYLDISGIAIDAPRGTWLLDPTDITISTNTGNACALVGGMCSVSGATSTINGATIAALLSASTDVTIDTASAGAGTGKINMWGTIVMNAASSSTTATLTLNADEDINFYGLSMAGNPFVGATNGKLNVALYANRSSHTAGTGVTDLNSGATIDTNGGYFSASGDKFSMAGGIVNTHGGTISITANKTTANGYSLGLSHGTLNSGGGKISLLSNNGITFGNAIVNAGSSFISMNPAASGLANNGNGAFGGTLITSGLELLGGANATYTSPSGAYIYAPGAIQSATAQTGNPTVTLAGDVGSLSAFYLNRAASGNSWAADLVIGTMAGMTVSGLNAHGGNVLLGTYNGNIRQTAPITNVNQLNVNSMAGTPDGNSIALTNAGNSVTTLTASAYDYPSGTAPTTAVLQFVNGGALSISYAYSGKGALDIRTTTGNLTIPSGSYVRSDYSGSAGNIVNAIVLVAGSVTPAYFVTQNTGYLTGYQGAALDNYWGTYSRFLVYSKDVTGTNLGSYTYTTANRRFETYYGASFHNPGSATPTSTDIPTTNNHGSYNTYGNAFVFQTAPTLTVTTNAASRNYGDANPTFTYSTSGLVMSDTVGVALTGTLSSAATPANGAGSYAINGGLSSPTGYSLGFTGGSLTVSPRPVSVTADAVTKTYGGADPAFTYSVTGGNLVNSDVLSLTRAAGENVGNYAIGLGSNPNYSVTYTGNDLSITKAALTVTANNATKTYDGLAYAGGNGVSYAGFVNGETSAVLGGSLSYGGTSQGATNAGTYGIAPSGLNSANYSIAYANGTLTINPAALTLLGVGADNKSKTYGDADPALTWSMLSGSLANGDHLSGSLVRDTGESVGSYAIRQGTLSAGPNYTINFTNGTFGIDRRTVTVAFGDTSKTYDGNTAANFGAASFGNAVAADLASLGVSGSAAYDTRHVGSGKAVTYSGLTLSGAAAGNYTLSGAGATGKGAITQATSVAWVGGTGGNWSNPANWAGGALPDGANVAGVVIPAGANVVFDGDASLDSISSQGHLTLSGGTLAVARSFHTPSYLQTGGTLTGAGTFVFDGSFAKSGGSFTPSGRVGIVQKNGDLAFRSDAPVSFDGLTVDAGNLDVDNYGGIATSALVKASGYVHLTAHSPITVGSGGIQAGTGILLSAPSTGSDSVIRVDGALASASGAVKLAAYGNISLGAGATVSAGSIELASTSGTVTSTPTNFVGATPIISDGSGSGTSTTAASSTAAATVQSADATGETTDKGNSADSTTGSSGASSSANAAAAGTTAGAAAPRKDDDGTLNIGRPRGRMLVCRKG